MGNSSDSLEEIIGLDAGYTGGVLQKRAQAQDLNDETEDKYIAEYVKQRQEKVMLKQMNDTSTHGRSLLGVSLHSVNNILDTSRRGGVTSLARATSAIDLMASNHSKQSSEVDLERSNKSEPVMPTVTETIHSEKGV